MTSFADAVASGDPLLTDGGIETRLVYGHHLSLPEHIEAAGLVGHPALTDVYASYLAAAAASGLPLVMGTPTFRAGARPSAAAGRDLGELNAAAVAHHRDLRAEHADGPIYVAGVVGPAGDAYTAAEALGRDGAEKYHAAQVEALADEGVDLLYAATFPSVEEAAGVARAMGRTGLPYVISYVLGQDGHVLDGSTLAEAVATVDAAGSRPPLFHSLSCIHPRIAERALGDGALDGRLLECKANASSLSTAELVALDRLDSGDPDDFARAMCGLRQRYGLRLLGGCCGTDDRHIRSLGALLAEASNSVPAVDGAGPTRKEAAR